MQGIEHLWAKTFHSLAVQTHGRKFVFCWIKRGRRHCLRVNEGVQRSEWEQVVSYSFVFNNYVINENDGDYIKVNITFKNWMHLDDDPPFEVFGNLGVDIEKETVVDVGKDYFW